MSYIISVESLPMEEFVFDSYRDAVDNAEDVAIDYCPDPDDDMEWVFSGNTIFLNIEIICADGKDFPTTVEEFMMRVERVQETTLAGDTSWTLYAYPEE